MRLNSTMINTGLRGYRCNYRCNFSLFLSAYGANIRVEMKPESPTRKARSSRKRRPASERIGKLRIRESLRREGGYSWTEFIVQGWRDESGRHARKKFKTRADAEAFVATKNVELTNADTALNNVVTRLSKAQVEEAEAAFTRLASRHSLGEAVDYFLRHFAQPDSPVPLDVARDAFLEARGREGVRSRSLVQLRSSLGQFVAFATLRLLPTELRPEIERIRAELGARHAATLTEIIRRLDPDLRRAARKLAEDAEDITAFLQRRIDPNLRDAVAKTRDSIEAGRRLSEREIADAVLTGVPGAKRPAVHEVGTADVEAFLRSLRTKDGKAAATRKTWNNARADVHTFLGWCADKQRRWCAENPVSAVPKFKIGRGVPHVLTVAQVRELMLYVATYEAGAMAKYFALALFAGLRSGPDGELLKLARHPERAKLIDVARGVIHVQPEISKTNQYRQTNIRPALHQWLTRFDAEIWPTNADRMLKHIRSRFSLAHDVLRHSFFSYLVGAEGSVERAALEGGNTEGILRRHYLNLTTCSEANEYWEILPPTDAESGGTIVRMRA